MVRNPWFAWSKGGDMSRFVEGTVIPKALLPEIGYVVACFSRLDAQLDLTIAHLLGADRSVGRAIAAAVPNYRPRIELCERLVGLKVTDKDDKQKLLRVVSAVGTVADERNRLIHDDMSSYDVGNEKLSLFRKEAIFRGTKPTIITKASLKELGMRSTDLSYRLQRFTKDDPRWKNGAQFPWRDRPLRRSRKVNPVSKARQTL